VDLTIRERKIEGAAASDNAGRRYQPVFYSRVFYDLPVAAMALELESGWKIRAVNFLAVRSLDLVQDQLVGLQFSDLFVTHPPPHVNRCSGRDLPVAGGLFVGVSQAFDFPPTIEVTGVSRFVAEGRVFAIVLFRPAMRSDVVQAGFVDRMFTDISTGLPNSLAAKRKMEMLSQAELRKSRIYALAIFSLENLSQFQDTPTFVMSRILRKVALRIRSWQREGVFLSRHNKNSFLIVLYGRQDYKAVLESIYTGISGPVIIGQNRYEFSVNAGVYTWSVWESVTASYMLGKVREAHYQSMLGGPGSWYSYNENTISKVCYDEEDRRISDAFRLGQLCLHFQPLFHFNPLVPQAAEALLRWNDTNGATKSPVEFLARLKDLPVFEEVTLWVLDLALISLERWHVAGHCASLCINIEAMQLADSGFVEKMLSVMSRFSSKTFERLNVDVVNANKLDDYDPLISSLRKLGVYGVGFAIDNFVFENYPLVSTEFLPIQSLKIARHCLTRLEYNLDDIRLVRQVICLAAKHNIVVYAKGVDRVGQFNVLKALGCSGVQGYLAAAPLMEADFLMYLDASHKAEPVLACADFSESFFSLICRVRGALSDALAACLSEFPANDVSLAALESLIIAARDIDTSKPITVEISREIEVLEYVAVIVLRACTESDDCALGQKKATEVEPSLLKAINVLSDLVVAFDRALGSVKSGGRFRAS
jgi:EAL domain-containing protein (putative c-di-GMP-specific phosphodiesterase class I)/GGDEF domain-containing protein